MYVCMYVCAIQLLSEAPIRSGKAKTMWNLTEHRIKKNVGLNYYNCPEFLFNEALF